MHAVADETKKWLVANAHYYVETHGLDLESVLSGYAALLDKPQSDWSVSDWMQLPKLVARMNGQDALYMSIVGMPEPTYDEVNP